MVVRTLAAVALALPFVARSAAAEGTAFERGLAAFQAGEFRAAVAPLEQAHAENPRDPDAMLLLGIAYYRLGREDDARPLLDQAEARGDSDTKASARVFLGLIAEHRGEGVRARKYYTLVARSSSSLGSSARLLLGRDGPERWSLVAILRPGYDSNVALLPTTAAAPGPGRGRGGGGDDAEATLVAGATARPIDDFALVLDTMLLYRRYASENAYDLLADTLGGTYTLSGVRDHATAAYHFEASRLGGERYQLAHVAEASARHAFAENWSLGARYAFAARDYAPADYAGYTGLYHTAGPELVWGAQSARTDGLVGYVFERATTDDSALASTGHGGRGQLRVSLSDRVELRGSVLAIERWFDGGRRDTQIGGDATAFIDVNRLVGLLAGATVTRNASNEADFEYTKWTIFAGVIVAAWPR